MYFTAITLTAVLHVQQFLMITAFPDSAPQAACYTIVPGHLNNQQQPPQFSYQVIIKTEEYIPEKNYTSKLQYILVVGST